MTLEELRTAAEEGSRVYIKRKGQGRQRTWRFVAVPGLIGCKVLYSDNDTVVLSVSSAEVKKLLKKLEELEIVHEVTAEG